MDLASRSLIEELGLKPFRPLPLLTTGKLQTIAGTYWPHQGEPSATRLSNFSLPDGDQIVIAENTPSHWQDGDRIVCLIHGLTGSHLSSYMSRLAHGFIKRGAKVIRMNLRSCGPGKGLAKKPYHCGISEDAREVIEYLEKVYSHSPVTLIGFSLGGNITLKMAGEDGNHPSGNLDSAIAVSPPVDVKQSSVRLSSHDNIFFDQYFTKRVLSDVADLHQKFPDLPTVNFPQKLSLAQFDHLYTAPRSGFKSGDDYYQKASSLPYLESIRIPTLILGSKDDPVISGECFEKVPRTKWIEKVVSHQGGHVGFLGFGAPQSLRWADHLILKWAEKRLSGIKPVA